MASRMILGKPGPLVACQKFKQYKHFEYNDEKFKGIPLGSAVPQSNLGVLFEQRSFKTN